MNSQNSSTATVTSAAKIASAALSAITAVNPVTGLTTANSHHTLVAKRIGEIFHLEGRLASLHASLGALVEEARECGVSDADVVCMIKAAAAACGIHKSTVSRVLLSAGIRQRASSEKREAAAAEKEKLTPEKAEASIKSILSGLSPAEQKTVLTRLALWAAHA